MNLEARLGETVISNRIKKKEGSPSNPGGLKRAFLPLLALLRPDSLVLLLICQVGPRPQGQSPPAGEAEIKPAPASERRGLSIYNPWLPPGPPHRLHLGGRRCGERRHALIWREGENQGCLQVWRQKSSRQPREMPPWLPLVQECGLVFHRAHRARGRGVCGCGGGGLPFAWSLEVEWGVINPSPCPSHKGAGHSCDRFPVTKESSQRLMEFP